MKRMTWLFAVFSLIFVPLVVLAQVAQPAVTGPTVRGFDLGPVLQALAGLVAIAITWLANSIRRKQEADRERTRAETAVLRLSALAVSMAGRAWDRLAPEVQRILADGRVTAEERAALEKIVQALVTDFTSADDLKAMAEALGLPLPGLIAKLAAMLLDTFTKAHDPGISEVSDLAYPVADDSIPASAHSGP